MLAKTSGVKMLIVVINKMDDPTVEWAQARYVLEYPVSSLFLIVVG